MKKTLVYTTLTKQSSWPKEWSEHQEFREHWQELKQILGKQLPGFCLSIEINKNLVLGIVAVKAADDVYNFDKGYKRLKEDYPVSEFVRIEEYYGR
jgi:hypothetical protein